jgi:NTE family protein
MRALEEQGIHVSFVAGTSMGAFIGSVYAAGNLPRLGTDFLAFDWRSVASLLDPVFPRSGLIDGQQVATFLSDYTSRCKIGDLPLPCRSASFERWAASRSGAQIRTGCPTIAMTAECADTLQSAARTCP